MRTRAFTYAAAAAVLSAALTACSGGSVHATSGTVENTSAAAIEGMSCADPNMPVGEWRKRCGGASPTPTAAAKQVAVGDTATISSAAEGLFKATLVQVVDPAAPANPYVGARPGNRYVALRWKVENVGSKALDSSDLYSSYIIDEQGEWHLATPATVAAGAYFPDGVHIAPGQTLEAFLVYELPQTAKPVTVQFLQPSGSPATQWRLT